MLPEKASDRLSRQIVVANFQPEPLPDRLVVTSVGSFAIFRGIMRLGMRGLRLMLVVSALGLTSCSTWQGGFYRSQPRCSASDPVTAEDQQCLTLPEVQEYLQNSRDEILRVWRMPARTAVNLRVELALRIDSAGAIQCLSLRDSSEKRFARSVLDAVEKTAPFGAVPSEAVCLARVPITATFENPEIPE